MKLPELKNIVRNLLGRKQWLAREASRLDRKILAASMAPKNSKKEDADRLFDVTIDPCAATGKYVVRTKEGVQIFACTGPCTLRLKGGSYQILVEGGDFPFTVSKDGTVTVDAAFPATVADKNHLKFHNRRIVIEPGAYDGAYYLAGRSDIPLRGSQEVVIVSGLPTFVSVYGTYPGTDIRFSTDAQGKIVPGSIMPATAAKCSQKELTFETARISVDTGGFNAGYILAGHYCEPVFANSGFNLVKGLTCYIEFYGCGQSQEVVFQLGGDGLLIGNSVSNPVAVTALNTTLAVQSREVKITTAYADRYRIGNTYFPAGSQDATFKMVLNNTTFLEIIESDSADITPQPGAVNPGSVAVEDDNGKPWTFTLV